MKTICIEGSDGIGKSTQVQLLSEKLKATIIKYPYYDSITGKVILDILNNHNSILGISPTKLKTIIQSLMTINRYETIDLINSSPTQFIVLDRYSMSSYVYGTHDGLPESFIDSINCLLPKPNLTIVMHGTPFRMNGDFYEQEEKQKIINELYIKYAKRFNYPLVDANQSIEEVHDDIMYLVNWKV